MKREISEKKLILYGAGEMGRRWAKKLGKDHFFRFADSDPFKVGQEVEGVLCCGIDELIRRKEEIAIFLSVSEKYKKDVRELLCSNQLDDAITNVPYSNDTLRACEGSKFDVNTVFEGQNFLDKECSIVNSYMGYASYLARHVELDGVKIGKYTTIGPGVSIIRGQHPARDFVSIHPSFYSLCNEGTNIHYCEKQLFDEFRCTKNGFTAEIGNDVWIGKNVQIMEGIEIGDGAILAAGAVIIKDVSPFTIVGGVPAKMIRDRFSEREKAFLAELQWWNKPEEWIRKYSVFFKDIKLLMKALSDRD